MSDKCRTVTICVHSSNEQYSANEQHSAFGLPKKLCEWPGFVAGVLSKVPHDMRSEVEVDFEIPFNDYGDDSEMTLSYSRPETDEEYASRLERDAANQQLQQRAQTEKELKLLAALKAKYER